ncbi:MAG: hypothetical protein KAV82_06305 [Phycisphaerae bacterium]|nr:hypothetical protein [Phycisphaerae bacterium]
MFANLSRIFLTVVLGAFLVVGFGCTTGGGGGGGGGDDADLCADVQCPDGQECNPATGQCEPIEDGDGDEQPDEGDEQPDEGDEQPDEGDEQPDEGDQPALVKTHILMDDNLLIMRPKAGDDLIVWGDAETVYYIIPSETDSEATAGTEVPDGTRFAWTSFAVAGKKAALVTSLGEVSIFDSQTGELSAIPGTEVLLQDTQLTEDSMPGLMVSDGNLIATLNHGYQVADGNEVKVIDVSGATPTVISFPNPTENYIDGSDNFIQVAVDADTRRVAGVGSYNILYVWEIDDPTAEPLAFDLGLNSDLCCFNDNVQIRFEGDWILYQQEPETYPVGMGDTNVALLNVDDGTVTVLTNNPTQLTALVTLSGGSFGYFQWREDVDAIYGAQTAYRSAIGTVPGPGSTLADWDDYIDGDSDQYGVFGYGYSMALTPDGDRWFVAGWGPIDDDMTVLQMSTGGKFAAFDDSYGDTLTGLVMATDVTCSTGPGNSGATVAFRALRQSDCEAYACATNEWVLGFIIVDRLSD